VTGASASADRATAAEPVVSALRDDIPSAVPTLDERNEAFIPPHFDMRGGKLGETPILWQFRMAYEWQEHFAEEHPLWDQCCTCWVFALSEREARDLVWDKFNYPHSVKPVAIASCCPERFENARDIELREGRTAQGTPTRSAETTGSVGEADGGPVTEGHAPETPRNSLKSHPTTPHTGDNL
jgi:hypothetical protein